MPTYHTLYPWTISSATRVFSVDANFKCFVQAITMVNDFRTDQEHSKTIDSHIYIDSVTMFFVHRMFSLNIFVKV